MNLDGIDIFVQVIKSGSFTKAAKMLGMPVTTVSGKIQALEKRLGVTLIHRTTRKLHLSSEGEIYFKSCERALLEIEKAQEELYSGEEGPSGILRVTASTDIVRVLLSDAIKSYLDHYKNMSIELILTNRVVDLVDEGVDLALRVGKLKDSTMIAKRFMETKISLWASSDYIKKNGQPKTIRSLKEHDVIRYNDHKESLVLTNGKESFQLGQSRGRLYVDDMDTTKKFVLSSMGIGLIPDFLCRDEEMRGELVKILPSWQWQFVSISFVYPPQRFVSLKVKSFIDWMEKEVKR